MVKMPFPTVFLWRIRVRAAKENETILLQNVLKLFGIYFSVKLRLIWMDWKLMWKPNNYLSIFALFSVSNQINNHTNYYACKKNIQSLNQNRRSISCSPTLLQTILTEIEKWWPRCWPSVQTKTPHFIFDGHFAAGTIFIKCHCKSVGVFKNTVDAQSSILFERLNKSFNLVK